MGVDPTLQVRFLTSEGVGQGGGGLDGQRRACVHVHMFSVPLPVLVCQPVPGVAAYDKRRYFGRLVLVPRNYCSLPSLSLSFLSYTLLPLPATP